MQHLLTFATHPSSIYLCSSKYTAAAVVAADDEDDNINNNNNNTENILARLQG